MPSKIYLDTSNLCALAAPPARSAYARTCQSLAQPLRLVVRPQQNPARPAKAEPFLAGGVSNQTACAAPSMRQYRELERD
ncbi:MAG TPA: hypothetical protein VGD52_11705 [Pseudoduganella sp.]